MSFMPAASSSTIFWVSACMRRSSFICSPTGSSLFSLASSAFLRASWSRMLVPSGCVGEGVGDGRRLRRVGEPSPSVGSLSSKRGGPSCPNCMPGKIREQNSAWSTRPLPSPSKRLKSRLHWLKGSFSLSTFNAPWNSSQSSVPEPSGSNSLNTFSTSRGLRPRSCRNSWTSMATSMTSFFSHAAAKALPMIVMGIVVRMTPQMSAAAIRNRLSKRTPFPVSMLLPRSPSYPSVSKSQKTAYIESKTSGKVSDSSFCRMPPKMRVATRMANMGTKIGRDERLTAMMSTRQPE
mmetsp:Transcript_74599/g.180336  ORF Transcript_74599/g.180336 Transcript_74599/m.180336 type:complete len:292 (+) Transcript_74599:365-1240(+)